MNQQEPIVPSNAISVSGRWVALRPVTREDLPTFFQWRADVFDLHIWAAQKRIPTYEEFLREADQLFKQSITFVVTSKRDAQPVGFVQAYNLNLTEGWGFLLAYTAKRYRRGHGVEATVALIDYLFRTFPLRKLYADGYEFNQQSMSPLLSAGFVEEGRFRAHTWHEDRYWDVTRYAIYRDDWYRFRERTHFVLGVGEEFRELQEEASNGRSILTNH